MAFQVVLGYEGILDSLHIADNALTAGVLVMQDTSSDTPKVVVSDGTRYYGILSVDVKSMVSTDYRSLVDLSAATGEHVGVYISTGIYETDQFVAGTYKPGDKLYITSAGKLTKTKDAQSTPAPTATTGIVEVGSVVEVDGNYLKVKIL